MNLCVGFLWVVVHVCSYSVCLWLMCSTNLLLRRPTTLTSRLNYPWSCCVLKRFRGKTECAWTRSSMFSTKSPLRAQTATLSLFSHLYAMRYSRKLQTCIRLSRTECFMFSSESVEVLDCINRNANELLWLKYFAFLIDLFIYLM